MLVLRGVRFATSKSALTDSSKSVLDEVAKSLAAWPELTVEVAGHTDASGDAAMNQRLSEARANAVRDYLVGRGIKGERLVAKGYGETTPIADNKSKEGREKNRRVELRRMDEKK